MLENFVVRATAKEKASHSLYEEILRQHRFFFIAIDALGHSKAQPSSVGDRLLALLRRAAKRNLGSAQIIDILHFERNSIKTLDEITARAEILSRPIDLLAIRASKSSPKTGWYSQSSSTVEVEDGRLTVKRNSAEYDQQAVTIIDSLPNMSFKLKASVERCDYGGIIRVNSKTILILDDPMYYEAELTTEGRQTVIEILATKHPSAELTFTELFLEKQTT